MLYYLIRRMLRFLLSARTICLSVSFFRLRCNFGPCCVWLLLHPVANTCSHSLYHSYWHRDGKSTRCYCAPNNCENATHDKLGNFKMINTPLYLISFKKKQTLETKIIIKTIRWKASANVFVWVSMPICTFSVYSTNHILRKRKNTHTNTHHI